MIMSDEAIPQKKKRGRPRIDNPKYKRPEDRIKRDSKEFAEMSAERIKRTKPWLKTTGPKTAEGKAKVSQNTLGTGRTAKHSLYLTQLVNQISISTAAILKEEREKYEAELSATSGPSDPASSPSSDD